MSAPYVPSTSVSPKQPSEKETLAETMIKTFLGVCWHHHNLDEGRPIKCPKSSKDLKLVVCGFVGVCGCLWVRCVSCVCGVSCLLVCGFVGICTYVGGGNYYAVPPHPHQHLLILIPTHTTAHSPTSPPPSFENISLTCAGISICNTSHNSPHALCATLLTIHKTPLISLKMFFFLVDIFLFH